MPSVKHRASNANQAQQADQKHHDGPVKRLRHWNPPQGGSHGILLAPQCPVAIAPAWSVLERMPSSAQRWLGVSSLGLAVGADWRVSDLYRARQGLRLSFNELELSEDLRPPITVHWRSPGFEQPQRIRDQSRERRRNHGLPPRTDARS
jgi:hypothetical protein